MKTIKNLLFLSGILTILFTGCKQNKSTLTKRPDVQVADNKNFVDITQSGLYLLEPGSQEIDSLKKVAGAEQFYTTADDSNFYISKILSSLKRNMVTLTAKTVNFKKENFTLHKSDYKNAWLIADYKEKSKPQIYTLVDFYTKFIEGNSVKSNKISAADLYLNNENFQVFTLDINNDGKDDKIFSQKPNTGDSLIVFFNDNNNFEIKLRTINLSQDGGQQVSAIETIKNGFLIKTDFPDGSDSYTYHVTYKDNIFTLKKAIHRVDSWQNKSSKKCQFFPELNLAQSSDKIFNRIAVSEVEAKCF